MRASVIRTAAAVLALALLAPAAATAARSGRSPAQWLAASVAAAKAASSVHVVASGIHTGGSKLSLNLRLTAGKGGGGRMAIGSESFAIVVVRPYVYFKANATFWRRYGGTSSSVVAQLLAGRWVKVSASNRGFASLVALTDISAFVTTMASDHGTLVAAGTRTVDGRAAVGIRDTSKSGGGTLWIAATGPPLPLQLAETGGSGRFDFESWNAPVHITAPADAVDFSHVKS